MNRHGRSGLRAEEDPSSSVSRTRPSWSWEATLAPDEVTFSLFAPEEVTVSLVSLLVPEEVTVSLVSLLVSEQTREVEVRACLVKTLLPRSPGPAQVGVGRPRSPPKR